LRAIIIDHNEADILALENYLKRSFSYVNVVAHANGITSGLNAINEYRPDIVFLDVVLADGSAFDLIKQFKQIHFKIIFISADSHYAIKAMRHKVFDYMLKPIDIEELTGVMTRIKSLSYEDEAPSEQNLFLQKKTSLDDSSVKKIVLATDNSIYVVEINDIMYCDADNGYTIFYLNNNTKIMVSRTLKEFETLLQQHQFIRIHKSHLVNFRYITRFSNEGGGIVFLKNNHSIPVSSRKRETIIKTINDSALN